jgi:glycosidase
MKRSFFVLIAILLFISCKKEKPDNDNIIPPPPDDTTSFVIPEPEDIVMYEINLRAFSNTGDFQGIINRMDEIKALGINVIWLMPVHPIGEINSVNSPYSVKNYKEVNPEFGSLSDFKTLVEEAHERNIAVIMDWVANHTAWDNPWITNTDWYTKDDQGNITHPPGTNWLDVADLNYLNPDMRLAMIDALKFWISTADIDGYRCDAADMVPNDFWKQAIDSVNKSTEKEVIWLAEGINTGLPSSGFQIIFSWQFYSQLKSVIRDGNSATSLVSVHYMETNPLADGKYRLRFTTNHDESAWDATPMAIFGGEQGALAASVAAIYLGGIPMIYSSQEVGTVQTVPFFSNQPINWALNPDMLQAYKDIIAFYNESEALRNGDMVSYSTTDVLAFTRKYELNEVFVMDNLRDQALTYDIPDEYKNLNWKDAFTDSLMTLEGAIELKAYGYIVLVSQ